MNSVRITGRRDADDGDDARPEPRQGRPPARRCRRATRLGQTDQPDDDRAGDPGDRLERGARHARPTVERIERIVVADGNSASLSRASPAGDQPGDRAEQPDLGQHRRMDPAVGGRRDQGSDAAAAT